MRVLGSDISVVLIVLYIMLDYYLVCFVNSSEWSQVNYLFEGGPSCNCGRHECERSGFPAMLLYHIL